MLKVFAASSTPLFIVEATAPGFAEFVAALKAFSKILTVSTGFLRSIPFTTSVEFPAAFEIEFAVILAES